MGQAGTLEIEITPEMVEAGEAVIFSDASDLLALGLEGPSALAAKVYRAMALASPDRR